MANVQEGPFMRIKAVETDIFGFSIDSGGAILKWNSGDMTAVSGVSTTITSRPYFKIEYGTNDVLYVIDAEISTGNASDSTIQALDPSDLTVLATRDFRRTWGLAFGYDGNVYVGVDLAETENIASVLAKLDAGDLSTTASVDLTSSSNFDSTPGIRAITHFDGFAYVVTNVFDPDTLDRRVEVFKVDTATMSVSAVYLDSSDGRQFANEFSERIIHDDEGFVYLHAELEPAITGPAGKRIVRIATSTMSESASTETNADTADLGDPGVTWRSGKVYGTDANDLIEWNDGTLAVARTLNTGNESAGVTWSSKGFLFWGDDSGDVQKLDLSDATIAASLSGVNSHSSEVVDVALDESIPDRIPIPSA